MDYFTNDELIPMVFRISCCFAAVVSVSAAAAGVVVFNVYPQFVVQTYRRYMAMKTGFKQRSVTGQDGFTFHYIEKEKADPNKLSVLMIHGFTSTKDSYCIVGHRFPKSMHIVSVDLPGHGDSSRWEDDDLTLEGFVTRIKQFVNLVGLDEKGFALLGTSLGGYIAGMYTLSHPNDVRYLSLICPAGIKMKNGSLLIDQYESTGKVIVMPKTVDEFYDMLRTVVYKEISVPKIFAKGLIEERKIANNFYLKIVEEFIPIENRYKLNDRLDEIKCPTMIIWGDKDLVVDISCLDVIKEKTPHWPITVFKDCGHSLTIEEPRRVGDEVVKFLEKHFISKEFE